MPRFSVVIATYNRGRHILPTLQSALSQTLPAHEILIVGDACDDDTEEVLAPYLGGPVRWHNLGTRCGSQSFPNNFGIARAGGSHIAYLGHDDVWAPNHLAELARTFSRPERPDFAVSGCLFHTPAGTGFCNVTGLFSEKANPAKHFFPPSSMAHTVKAARVVGDWSAPETVKAPVDTDFQLRASRAGLRFLSTRQVTVHKFAAGHRYLSYLRQESAEQKDMLARMARPDYAGFVGSLVAQAREAGTFMTVRNSSYEAFAEGEAYRKKAASKGIVRPPLTPLAGKVTIPPGTEPRALDWQSPAPETPDLRRSGPNPRPKLLLPYSRPGRVPGGIVLGSMVVAHASREALETVRLCSAGKPLAQKLIGIEDNGHLVRGKVRFAVALQRNDYTILEIEQPQALVRSADARSQRGIAAGAIELAPVDLRRMISDPLDRCLVLGALRRRWARAKAQ